ncbi:MAG: LysR family transcriptional regulator, low CO2-responsive transcriptional regulator [Solirubrobacteraceae bacterium]|jgi:DNA-binding transcriptional LysR family regulator|nr:LysR family transcriptional regulator, low CO2-responsive transcriptional regulator [Solirubrobacteraceae bacterium]
MFSLLYAILSNDRHMAITVTQLTAFLAVVRGGSVTAAADELIVTQPSVSAAIAALSRELGSELFERAGRGIRPTNAGTAFAPYAEDVMGLLDQGRRAAREAAAVAARKLKIAAVTTAAESFVPPLMRAFGQEHPGLELALDVGNRQRVLERVLSHAADVAITGRPPTDDRLIAMPIMDNEIVCITSPDDPLVSEGAIPASTLAGRAWLLREPGSGTRALGEQFLKNRDMAPETLTLGSNGAIKQAARVGLGVSLLSRAAVQAEIEAGLLGELVLTNPPPPRPWFVLHSAVGPVRDPVAAFVTFVRTAVAERVVAEGR